MNTNVKERSKLYQTPYPVNRHVVIFHASCADGFCAATLLWEALVKHSEVTDVLLHPSHYGEPLPQDLGQNDVVYLTDFSYKRDVMHELCKKVQYVYVLDHHKTAKEELAQLKLTDVDNIAIFFDMERSGAMMTFDFLECSKAGLLPHLSDTLPLPRSHPEVVPALVKYVQDRDLWKFELPKSKEISAYLRSIKFDTETWANLLIALDNEIIFNNCVRAGAAILRFQEMQVASAADKAADINFPLFPGATHGMPVKMVNTTVNHSEVGEVLCSNFDIPFAVSWFYRKDGKFQYSLRSHGGYDVSKIAKAYGGGGHPTAAGFEWDELIIGPLAELEIKRDTI